MRERVRREHLHGNAYLEAHEVIEMRDLFAQGKTQKQLAKKYDISVTTVSRVVRRETYRYVNGGPETMRFCKDCGKGLSRAMKRCGTCRPAWHQEVMKRWRDAHRNVKTS